MKLMKKTVLIILTLCMLLQLVACSNNSGTKFEITQDEFNAVLEQFKENYKQRVGEEAWDANLKDNKEFNESLEEVVLDNIILEKVVLDEAKKANLEITEETINAEIEKIKTKYPEAEDYEKYLADIKMTEEELKADIKKQLTIQQFLKTKADEMMKLEPTEKQLKDLYNKYKEAFKQVKASHILVATEEEALSIKEKLTNGGDFAELAKDLSICPSSAEGGDLGYFSANSQLVQEFKDAAFGMKIDEISDPVKTQFGYHIIKITDIKDSFEVIDKEEIKYEYRALKYDEMLNDYVNNANVTLSKELKKIRDRSKKNK